MIKQYPTLVALCLTMSTAAVMAQNTLTPQQMADARHALIAWYECIECISGELERVLKYGSAAEGALASTLNTGMAPAKRSQLERTLRRNYDSVKATMPVDEYVRFYLGNADSTYRSRAAIALGRLNTPTARASLESALKTTNRTEVRRAIESALRSSQGADPR